MEPIKTVKLEKKINVVFIGNTGVGKSTTCNWIAGEDVFPSSDDMTSCTSYITTYNSKKVPNLRIIDTPGFNDNRQDEKVIDNILQQLTLNIVDYADESSNQVDAFILLTKCTPRADSIKSNIEHLRALFGTIALKSTIIVLIHDCKKVPSDEVVSKELKDMNIIHKIFSEAGVDTKSNENWYHRWDNFEPYPNQMENLLQKIKLVEPYTHERFQQAQKDIEEQMNQQVKQKVDKEIQMIKQDYKNNLEVQKQKMQEIEQSYQQKLVHMKTDLVKSQNNWQYYKQIQMQGTQEMKDMMKNMLELMHKEKEESNKYMMQQLKNSQEQQQNFKKEVMEKLNTQIISEEKQLMQVMELMRSQQQAQSSQNEQFQAIVQQQIKQQNKYQEQLLLSQKQNQELSSQIVKISQDQRKQENNMGIMQQLTQLTQFTSTILPFLNQYQQQLPLQVTKKSTKK